MRGEVFPSPPRRREKSCTGPSPSSPLFFVAGKMTRISRLLPPPLLEETEGISSRTIVSSFFRARSTVPPLSFFPLAMRERRRGDRSSFFFPSGFDPHVAGFPSLTGYGGERKVPFFPRARDFSFSPVERRGAVVLPLPANAPFSDEGAPFFFLVISPRFLSINGRALRAGITPFPRTVDSIPVANWKRVEHLFPRGLRPRAPCLFSPMG